MERRFFVHKTSLEPIGSHFFGMKLIFHSKVLLKIAVNYHPLSLSIASYLSIYLFIYSNRFYRAVINSVKLPFGNIALFYTIEQ